MIFEGRGGMNIPPGFEGINVVSGDTSSAASIPEPGGLPAPLDMRAASIIGRFIAFQNAGYLAGHPFETTYAVIAKEAREFLRGRL